MRTLAFDLRRFRQQLSIRSREVMIVREWLSIRVRPDVPAQKQSCLSTTIYPDFHWPRPTRTPDQRAVFPQCVCAAKAKICPKNSYTQFIRCGSHDLLFADQFRNQLIRIIDLPQGFNDSGAVHTDSTRAFAFIDVPVAV